MGDSDHPFTVKVVDRSGTLRDARVASKSELDLVVDLPCLGAQYSLPNQELLIAWTRSICDTAARVTFEPGFGSVTIAFPLRGGCDAVGRYGGLVVLTAPVDAESVELRFAPQRINRD